MPGDKYTRKELATIFNIDPNKVDRASLIDSGNFASQTQPFDRQGANIDEYNFGVIEGQDPNEIRALNQSGWEKWGHGIARAGTTMATSAIENTVGLIAGIGTAVLGGDVSGMHDNFVGNAVDATNKAMQEAMPIYSTKEESETPWYMSAFGLGAGTANFWADKFLNGAAYFGGAMLTGYGLGALANKSARAAAKALAVGSIEEAGAAAVAKQLIPRSTLTNFGISASMAHGESSVEARGIMDNIYQKLESEREQGLNDYSDDEILAISKAGANSGYLVNMALVGGTDFMQFGKMLFTGKAVKATVAEAAQDAKKFADILDAKKITNFDRYVKEPLKGIGIEGGQELGQLGIEKGATEYYTAKYDKDSNLNWISSMSDMGTATMKALGTAEGWESIFLGGLLGGAGQFNQGRKDAIEQDKRNKQAVDLVNNIEGFSQLALNKDNVLRMSTYGAMQEEAARTGNDDLLQDAKSGLMKSYVQALEESGGTELAKKKLNLLRNAEPKDVQAFFNVPESYNFTKEELNDKIDKISKDIDYHAEQYQAINRNYPGIDRAVRDVLYDSVTGSNDVNKRIGTLSTELQNLSGGFISDLSFDSVEFAKNEDYRKDFADRFKKAYDYIKEASPFAAKQMAEKYKALKYLAVDRAKYYKDNWEKANKDPEKFVHDAQLRELQRKAIIEQQEINKDIEKAIDDKHFKENTTINDKTGFTSSDLEYDENNKVAGHLEVEYGDNSKPEDKKKAKFIRREGELRESQKTPGVFYGDYWKLNEDGKEELVKNVLNPKETVIPESVETTTKKLQYTNRLDKNGRAYLRNEEGQLLVDEQGNAVGASKFNNLRTVKTKEQIVAEETLQLYEKAFDNLIEYNGTLLKELEDTIEQIKEENKVVEKILKRAETNKSGKAFTKLGQVGEIKGTVKTLRTRLTKNNNKIEKLLVERSKLNSQIGQFNEDVQSLLPSQIEDAVKRVSNEYERALSNTEDYLKILSVDLDNTNALIYKLTKVLALKNISVDGEDTQEDLQEIVTANIKAQDLYLELKGFQLIQKDLQELYDNWKDFQSEVEKESEKLIEYKNKVKYIIIPKSFEEATNDPENGTNSPEYTEELEKKTYGAKKSIINGGFNTTTGKHFLDDDDTKINPSIDQQRWYRTIPKVDLSDTTGVYKLKVITTETHPDFFDTDYKNDKDAIAVVLYKGDEPVNSKLEETELNSKEAVYTILPLATLSTDKYERFYEEGLTEEEKENIRNTYEEFRKGLIDKVNLNPKEDIWLKIHNKSGGVVKIVGEKRSVNNPGVPILNSPISKILNLKEEDFDIVVPNTNVLLGHKVTKGIPYMVTKTGQIIPLKSRTFTDEEATNLAYAFKYLANGVALQSTKVKYTKTFIKGKKGKKGYWKSTKIGEVKETLEQKAILSFINSMVYINEKTKGTPQEFYLKSNILYFNNEKIDLKDPKQLDNKLSGLTNFLKTKYHNTSNTHLRNKAPFSYLDFSNANRIEQVTYDNYLNYMTNVKKAENQKNERKAVDLPLTLNVVDKGEDTIMSSYFSYIPEASTLEGQQPINKTGIKVPTKKEPDVDDIGAAIFGEQGEEPDEDFDPLSNPKAIKGIGGFNVPVTSTIPKTENVKTEDDFFGSAKLESNTPETIEIQKSIKWLQERFPNIDVKIVNTLIQGKAWGLASKYGVQLSKLAGKGTEYHEGFHMTLLMYLKENEKQELFNKAKDVYEAPTEEDLEGLKLHYTTFTQDELVEQYYEELMADDFMDYMNNSKLPERLNSKDGIFQKIFNKLKEWINLILNTNLDTGKSPINSLFESIKENTISLKPYNKFDTIKERGSFKLFNNIPVDAENALNKSIAYHLSNYFGQNPKEIFNLLNPITGKLEDLYFNNGYIQTEIKKDLTEKYNELVNQKDDAVIGSHLKTISILYNAVDNAGAWSKIANAFIKQYYQKLGIELDEFEVEDDTISNEDKKVQEGISNGEYDDASKVKMSMAEYTDPRIKLLLSSLPKYTSSGKPYINAYNLKEVEGFEYAMSTLIKHLSNSLSIEDMVDKVKKLSIRNKTFNYLHNILNSIISNTNPTWEEFLLLEKFHQTFAKARIDYSMLIMGGENSFNFQNTSEEVSIESILDFWKSSLRETHKQEGSILDNNSPIGNPEISINKFNEAFAKIDKLKVSNLEKDLKKLEVLGLQIDLQKVLDENSIDNRGINKAIEDFIHTTVAELNKINKNISVEKLFADIMLSKSRNVAKEVIQIEKTLVENNHRGPDGETRYDMVMYNLYTKIAATLNNLTKREDFDEALNEKFPYLLNVYNRNSLLVGYDSKLKNNEGFRNNTAVKISILEGAKSENIGDTINNLKESDRVAMYFNALLENKIPFLQSSDKSLQFVIDMKNINTITTTNEFVNQMVLYLQDEFNRVKLHTEDLLAGNEKVNQIQYYKENGGKFTLFEGILQNDNLLSKLTKAAKNSSTANKAWIDFLKGNHLELEQALLDYLYRSKNESFQYLVDKSIFKIVEGKLVNIGISAEKLSKSPTEEELNAVMQQASINSIVGYVEQLKVFIGDPAYFKSLNDVFKRIPLATGMKKTTEMSKYSETAIDNLLKRQDLKATNGEEKIITFKDNIVKLSNYQELLDSFIKSGLPKEKSIELLHPYTVLNEADAQGYITLDALQEFMMRSGEFSPDYYELIERAKRGEELDSNDITKVLNIQKLVYGGPSKLTLDRDYDKRLYIPTYLKFSVLPLIPSLIKGTNLEKLNNNMIENQVGYALFESANKVGGLKQLNGNFHSIYNNKGEYNSFNDDTYYNTIDTNFMGIQVDIAPYSKGEGIMGTQENKLITAGLFRNGKPIDITILKYTNNGKTVSKETVSGKTLQDRYNELNNITIIEGYDKLLKELGLTKEGKIFNFKDGSKLKQLLLEQAINRNSSQNVIEAINLITDNEGVVRNGIDAFPNKTKLEQILFAIVKNKVIRRKSAGGAKIQVAVSGFENINRAVDTENVYSSNQLKFYRKGRLGETLPMQVAIALPEFMKSFVISKFSFPGNNSLETALDNFNEHLAEFFSNDSNRYDDKAIEALGVDLKMLRYIGYRIPTQGLNSIENMEIVKFLSPTAGDAIVVPSGIVGKAGSDFDIDKLNIFQPYFIEHNGNLIYATAESVDKYKEDIEAEIDEIKKSNDTKEVKNVNIKELRKNLSDNIKDFKAEKNEMYEISQNILSAPENFVQLLTPNTADTLKDLAKEVQKAYKIDNNRPMSTLLSWEYNNIVAGNNWVGKAGVGIAALHTTTHRLFQEVGAEILRTPESVLTDNPTKLSFKGMEHEYSISNSTSFDKKYNITEVISQFLNAYVDIAKEPFILDLNAGLQVAGVYFYLVRRGVPIDTISYFMNQPIIREYVRERAIQESQIVILSDEDESKEDTIKRIKNKYISKTGLPEIYSKEELKKSMEDNENLSDSQKALQSKVLQDFLVFMGHSNQLSNVMQSINQDTKFYKTEQEFVAKQKIDIPKALENDIFNKTLIQDVYDKTLINSYQKISADMPYIYKELTPFLDSAFEENRNFFIELYKKRGTPKDEVSKVLNLLANDWITYLLQTNTYTALSGKKIRIEDFYKNLFLRENKNFAKTLNSIQKGTPSSVDSYKIKNNIFVKNIVASISNPLSNVDNVRLINRKMDAFTEDTLVEGYKELLDLYKETDNLQYKAFISYLLPYSIAQSGLSMSYLTFVDKLSSSKYLEFTKEILQGYLNNIQTSHDSFLDQFIKNNYKNDYIVPKAPKTSQLNKFGDYVKKAQTGENGKVEANEFTNAYNYPYIKVWKFFEYKDEKGKPRKALRRTGEKLGYFKLFKIEKTEERPSKKLGSIKVRIYTEVNPLGDNMYFKEYQSTLKNSVIPENIHTDKDNLSTFNKKVFIDTMIKEKDEPTTTEQDKTELPTKLENQLEANNTTFAEEKAIEKLPEIKCKGK